MKSNIQKVDKAAREAYSAELIKGIRELKAAPGRAGFINRRAKRELFRKASHRCIWPLLRMASLRYFERISALGKTRTLALSQSEQEMLHYLHRHKGMSMRVLAKKLGKTGIEVNKMCQRLQKLDIVSVYWDNP